MKASLQTFDAGLASLIGYLQGTDLERTLLTSLRNRIDGLGEIERDLVERITTEGVSRRQYVHSVAIISLYGLLERFVDSVIESFVTRIGKEANSYKDVPEAIARRHTMFSLDLVRAILDDRHKGGLSEATVIENLHLCISGASGFRLNGAAFVLHRGNLSLSKIGEFLAAVGIDNHFRRASRAVEMVDYLRDIYPDRDIQNVADADLGAIFEPIDNLVERRNEISHGVISVDNVDSVDLLVGRCMFVGAYVRSLYRIIVQELFRHIQGSLDVLNLGRPLVVYNHNIVCFELEQGRVSLGDLMVASTGDGCEPFRFGRIESLEIDHQSVPEVVAEARVRFGARVPFRASDTYSFFRWIDESI